MDKSDTQANLLSFTHQLTPALESSVKNTALKLFRSYGTYKSFTRWKPEKRLLLRCIAHLFRAISRCKPQNRPFSFDPFQLDSECNDPDHVLMLCTKTAAVFLQAPWSVSHLTYGNANEDKTNHRTPKMQAKIRQIKGHTWASACPSCSHVASSWGEEILLRVNDIISSVPVMTLCSCPLVMYSSLKNPPWNEELRSLQSMAALWHY